jgi:hypothetical protein
MWSHERIVWIHGPESRPLIREYETDLRDGMFAEPAVRALDEGGELQGVCKVHLLQKYVCIERVVLVKVRVVLEEAARTGNAHDLIVRCDVRLESQRNVRAHVHLVLATAHGDEVIPLQE